MLSTSGRLTTSSFVASLRKAKAGSQELCDEDFLVLPTKALNDTAGPNGLVLTFLVFGVLPRILFVSSELPTEVQRMKAMETARKDMSKLVARSRMKVALKAYAPGSSTLFEQIKIGSEVLM